MEDKEEEEDIFDLLGGRLEDYDEKHLEALEKAEVDAQENALRKNQLFTILI